MARGGHRLPKVLLRPAMPNPFKRGATPETAFWLFEEYPAHKAGGLRPSSTLLDTPRRTPMISRLFFVRRHQLLGKYRIEAFFAKKSELLRANAQKRTRTRPCFYPFTFYDYNGNKNG
jgi:hypothetical protein